MLNLPNLLTYFRFLLVPAVTVALLYGEVFLALALFALASVTDMLDGFFARLLHQHTPFGSFIDPLADKALLISSFYICSFMGLVPLWVAALAIIRDVLIMAGVWKLGLRRSNLMLKPLFISKANTAGQMVYLVLVLANQALNLEIQQLVDVAGYAIAGLTALSFVAYLRVFRAYKAKSKIPV